jgi:hypothetical protein
LDSLWNNLNQRVEELLYALGLRHAGTDDRFDAEPVKAAQIGSFGLIDFINYQKDGLTALERHLGDAPILFGDGDIGFDDYPDNIGAVSRLNNLLLNGKFKLVFGILDTGGIDQPELLIAVLGFSHDAVSSGTGFTGHDCFAPIEDSIKQAGLPHVRPPDNCYNR